MARSGDDTEPTAGAPRARRSHPSDRLNRGLIRTWHDLCVRLGDRFTVSESAISHLFVGELLASGFVAAEDLCPEDYDIDGDGAWRRIDLLIGAGLLYETGRPRAVRSRRLAAAVEYKVESEAVTIRLPQIEADAVKLQGLAESQRDGRANFHVLVLFRSKRDLRDDLAAWKAMSSRFDSVRFVVGFAAEGSVHVLHLHRGRVRDIAGGGGHFYRDWLSCRYHLA